MRSLKAGAEGREDGEARVRTKLAHELEPGDIVWCDGDGWGEFQHEDPQSRPEIFDFTAIVSEGYEEPFESRVRQMRDADVLVRLALAPPVGDASPDATSAVQIALMDARHESFEDSAEAAQYVMQTLAEEGWALAPISDPAAPMKPQAEGERMLLLVECGRCGALERIPVGDPLPRCPCGSVDRDVPAR